MPWAAFGAPYLLSFDTKWTNPTDSERNIAWTRAAWAEMRHFAPGGLYLDFAGFREEKEAMVSPWLQNGDKTDENRLDRQEQRDSEKRKPA